MTRRALAIGCAAGLAVFAGLYLGFRGEPILLQFQGSQLVPSAHSLNRGLGFLAGPDKPLAKFPPLYALLLAPLERAGLGVVEAAYLVNAAFFGLGFVGLAALAGALRLASSAWLAATLTAWGLLAPNLYLVRSVRPDLIPISMSLIAFAALLAYARGGSVRALLLAAGASALAALARYMALFTLLPVCAVAVLCWAGSRARRVRDVLLYAAVSAGPVLLWLARNQRLTGYASGMSRFEDRPVRSERLSLLDNLRDIASSAVLDGFSFASLGVRLQGEGGERPDGWLALGLAGLAAVLVGLAFAKRGRGTTSEPAQDRRSQGGEADEARAVQLLAGFAIFYPVALTALWTVGNNDPINTRYLAPTYPCLLLLALHGIRRLPRGQAWPAALALALVLVPNAVKTVRLAGPAPNEQLIELRVWPNRPSSWRHAIEWDDTKRVVHPLDEFRGRGD